MSDPYPWPGNFKTGEDEASVAVVTLDERMDFDPEKVAIWGPMKTENLGIEKVIANVVSNPNIRFLLICGEEIRGHKSGSSLLALIKNGLEENGRIKDAPGAVPYIENLPREAVDIFRDQVKGIYMIGETDLEKIEEEIDDAVGEDLGSYGEPYIAVQIEGKEETKFSADYALHSRLKVSPWGKISPLKEAEDV